MALFSAVVSWLTCAVTWAIVGFGDALTATE
jgi:hypothetical protein